MNNSAFSRQQMQKSDCERFNVRLLTGAAVALLLVLIFYPDFVFLKSTPMSARGWELSDAWAGPMNFVPGFQVLQHEFFKNHNLLWSSLRSMGLPLLANDIQAAPLFPLTLLLCWIPAEYYWNIYIVVRLVLLATGTYLLARSFLKLKLIPAVFFILSFVYSMYVLRWLNHPWQNGLLAGIWYLYFLAKLPDGSLLPYCRRRFWITIGLALSVYAMVTCGFPEAAVMSAILVVLTYCPFIVQRLLQGKIHFRSFCFDILLAHGIGFILASAQICSIFEMLSLYADTTYRSTAGLRQFAGDDFLPFWAENIGRITGRRPELFNDSRTYLGLVPLFFFLIGLSRSVIRFRQFDYRNVGAFLCCIFILLKLFPLLPGFNVFLGGLPVLKDSYFFVYFFPLFLWFFAFYTALGVETMLQDKQTDNSRFQAERVILLLGSVSLVLGLVWWSVETVYRMPPGKLLTTAQGDTHIYVLASFGVALVATFFLIFWQGRKKVRIVLGLFLVSAVVSELLAVQPRDFRKLRMYTDRAGQIAAALEEHGLAPAEERIRDSVGKFVSAGIATVDDGAPALLPQRLFVFRRTLFDVSGGYFPIRKPLFNYSWPLTSTSLFLTQLYWGGAPAPPWQEKRLLAGGRISIDAVRTGGAELPSSQERTLSGKQRLKLRGWAVDTLSGRPDDRSSVFIIFRSEATEFSLPTRKGYSDAAVEYFQSEAARHSGWQLEVEAGFFESGTYDILIRALRFGGQSYFEQDTGRRVRFQGSQGELNTFKRHQKQFGRGGNYLTSIPDGFLYRDPEALPRAYTASGCFTVDNFSMTVEKLGAGDKFTPGDVYVEQVSEAERKLCDSVGKDRVGKVPIKSDTGSKVVLGEVMGPAVLVLNDSYYPGWKAFDRASGETLAIKPANIAVRAVFLPEQRTYQIVFRYAPSWLLPVTIACAAVFLLLGLLFMRAHRSRK